MKCGKVGKNLSAYADGELKSKLRQRVERHLALCEKCAAELAGLKELTEAARATLRKMVSAKAPPHDLRERVMQAVQPIRASRPILIPVRKLVVGAALIALASGSCVGVGLELRFRSEREVFRRRIAEQRSAIAVAEKDSATARAHLVETRTALRMMREQLRLAFAERIAIAEVAERAPAAGRSAWPPVLSSLQMPGAKSLLENGLF